MSSCTNRIEASSNLFTLICNQLSKQNCRGRLVHSVLLINANKMQIKTMTQIQTKSPPPPPPPPRILAPGRVFKCAAESFIKAICFI